MCLYTYITIPHSVLYKAPLSNMTLTEFGCSDVCTPNPPGHGGGWGIRRISCIYDFFICDFPVVTLVQGEKLIRHYDQNMRTNWLFADVFVWCGIFPLPVGSYCMLLEPKTTIYTQQESTRMWFTTTSGSREVHNKSKSPKFDRCGKICTLLDFGSQIHNLIILISTIPIYQNRSISIFANVGVGGDINQLIT